MANWFGPAESLFAKASIGSLLRQGHFFTQFVAETGSMPRTAVSTVSTTALATTNLSTSIRRWRLAGMAPSADTTRAYWTGTYLPRWTFWNTVRMLACGVSAGILLFGLLWMTQAQVATLQVVAR